MYVYVLGVGVMSWFVHMEKVQRAGGAQVGLVLEERGEGRRGEASVSQRAGLVMETYQCVGTQHSVMWV